MKNILKILIFTCLFSLNANASVREQLLERLMFTSAIETLDYVIASYSKDDSALNLVNAIREVLIKEANISDVSELNNKSFLSYGHEDSHKALYILGVCCEFGVFVDIDYAEAKDLYVKSAELGGANACLALASLYKTGTYHVFELSISEAQKWYALAGKYGNAKVKKFVGEIFESGNGLPVDRVLAFHFYEEAAKLDDAEAMFKLGKMCSEKEAYSMDAVDWYFNSAIRDDARGALAMGEAYSVGTFLPVDADAALNWTRLAAFIGDDEIKRIVANKFTEGIDVKQDYAEAYFWLKKQRYDLTSNEIKKYLTLEEVSQSDLIKITIDKTKIINKYKEDIRKITKEKELRKQIKRKIFSLSEGVTREEVVAIIGSNGIVVKKASLNNITRMDVEWVIDGEKILISFMDDKVVQVKSIKY